MRLQGCLRTRRDFTQKFQQKVEDNGALDYKTEALLQEANSKPTFIFYSISNGWDAWDDITFLHKHVSIQMCINVILSVLRFNTSEKI